MMLCLAQKMQQQILEALSQTHPISASTIHASLVNPPSKKDLQPVLVAMVESGLIIEQGKKYLKP